MNFVVCKLYLKKAILEEEKERSGKGGGREKRPRGRHIENLCGERLKFILCCPSERN